MKIPEKMLQFWVFLMQLNCCWQSIGCHILGPNYRTGRKQRAIHVSILAFLAPEIEFLLILIGWFQILGARKNAVFSLVD